MRDVLLFAEALLVLGLASLAIKLPFRWLARLMSLGKGSAPVDQGMSADIVKSVERAARRFPWRTVCFHQGLATHWMHRLRRSPSFLHYGIKSGGHELAAHVWVTVDGKIVIGEAEAANHALVATFPTDVR